MAERGGSGDECAGCNSAARGRDLCAAVPCYPSLDTSASPPGYDSLQGLGIPFALSISALRVV